MEVIICEIKQMNSYLVNERRLLIDEAKKNPESGEHNCFSGGYQFQTSKQVVTCQPVETLPQH